jgi:alanine racemase
MNQFVSPYPTWVEVDLGAIAHNTRQLLQVSGTAVMAVVKAEAYGHGMIAVARTALENGATWLGVARLNEARQLRAARIAAPTLVFGLLTPAEVDEAIASDISVTLHSFECAELLIERAAALGRPVHAHLKVDTGMGRLGVLPEEALLLAERAASSGRILLEGLYSHLAEVDDDPNAALTVAQLRRFGQALHSLEEAGLRPPYVHLANSAAAYALPEARFDLVRAGSAIVGLRPFYYAAFPANMRRSLRWQAQLAACKRLPAGWNISYGQEYQVNGEEWIGVIPVGYGDGLRRQPGNQVLIEGQRLPIVGRICIDQCMVRLPRPMAIGSLVTLIGQQGNEAIYVEELVQRWHSSEAGVTSGISGRVPRCYVNGG